MNGTLITSTSRGNMHPLAYQGILATDCHHQIVTLLRSRLGDTHVLLFAEPAFDPGRDIVDWYTPVQGTPVKLIDLPKERQDQVRATLLKMASDILTQAQQLKNTGDNNRVLSGSIIELALQYPGEDCIYLVGEQPVIVCWGFGSAQDGARPEDLSRLAPQSPPARPRPAPSVSEPAPPAPKAGGAPETEPVPVTEVILRRRRWPWWLTALLGLLLLLVLLFFLWRFLGKPMPGWLSFLLPQQAAVLPAGGGGTSADSGDLAAALAHRQDLLKQRDALRAALLEKAGQCQEPAAADADAAKHGKALQVPAEAAKGNDLGFLQGVWRCDTDLSTPQDPVTVDYIFDAAGKGQITVKTSKKICSAGVKASLDAQGTLHIDSDETIPCSTGDPIDGQRVECVGKEAQTTCTGENRTSKGTWKAKFYKF